MHSIPAISPEHISKEWPAEYDLLAAVVGQARKDLRSHVPHIRKDAQTFWRDEEALQWWDTLLDLRGALLRCSKRLSAAAVLCLALTGCVPPSMATGLLAPTADAVLIEGAAVVPVRPADTVYRWPQSNGQTVEVEVWRETPPIARWTCSGFHIQANLELCQKANRYWRQAGQTDGVLLLPADVLPKRYGWF